jgi:cell division protein FtsL
MPKTDTSNAIPAPSPELTERRYVYSGDGPSPERENVPRGNRPVKRRKQSPFFIISGVVAFSLLIVVYVWIKISVDQLVVDVQELKSQHQRILDASEVLRAEINRKSTWDRIGKLATEQLSMSAPKEQPRMFDIDPDELERVKVK